MTTAHISFLVSKMGTTSPNLTRSEFLPSASPHDLGSQLVSVYFVEWAHWSLTFSVRGTLVQEAIDLLWSSSRSVTLVWYPMHFTFLVWKLPSASWLMSTASPQSMVMIGVIYLSLSTQKVLSLYLLSIVESLLLGLHLGLTSLHLINHIKHIFNMLRLVILWVIRPGIVLSRLGSTLAVHNFDWPGSVEELGLVLGFRGELLADYLVLGP